MSYLSKKYIFIIIILIGLFLLFKKCDDLLSGGNSKEHKKFYQIYLGMSKDSVFKLIGKPDDSSIYFYNEQKFVKYTFFTNNTPLLAADLATVTCDSSNKVVHKTFFGD